MKRDFSYATGAKLGATLLIALGAVSVLYSIVFDLGSNANSLLTGLLGALIAILAIMALRAPLKSAPLFAITLILGLLLAYSPFYFGVYKTYPIAYFMLLAGLLTTVFSAFSFGEALELNIPLSFH